MAEEFPSPAGSPIRYADPSPASSPPSFTTLYVLDEPVVEAVYASFIIVSWCPPRTASNDVADGGTTPPRAGWKYLVEWQGTHSLEPHTTNVSHCHIVVPVEFTNESYNIRVVAKGTVLTSVDQASSVFVSAKITVPTRRKTNLVWLQDGAVLSPVLRDALVLASHSAFPNNVAALMHRRDQEEGQEGEGEGAGDGGGAGSSKAAVEWLGKGTLKHCNFQAVRVTYATDAQAFPLQQKRVVYVLTDPLSAASSIAGKEGADKGGMPVVGGARLVELIRDEQHCVVFAGVGNCGAAASFAAHRLIASVMLGRSQQTTTPQTPDPSPERRRAASTTTRQSGGGGRTLAVEGDDDVVHKICSRVYCITFGSAREEFYANGVVLAGTCAYSGQFLHYTSSVAIAARTSGFFVPPTASAAPVAAKGGAKNGASSSSSAKYLTVPLGIRVGPVLDNVSNEWYLRASASQFEKRHDDEEAHTFDVLGALVALDLVSAQRSLQQPCAWLAAMARYGPKIESCEVTSDPEHDGLALILIIRGAMLHFQPRVMVLTGGRGGGGRDDSLDSTLSSPVSMLGRCGVVAEVLSASPTKLTARCSLLDTAPLEAFVDTPRPTVAFSVVVSTSAGTAAPTSVELQLSDMLVILAVGPSPPSPDAWINGKPDALLSACIVQEPVLASAQTSSASTHIPHITSKLLSMLEWIADVVMANTSMKKKETSFFSSLAAKVAAVSPATPAAAATVGNKGATAQLLHNIVIPTSAVHGGTFTAALSEHVRKRRAATTFQGACTPWRSKLMSVFPWLADDAYSQKLSALVRAIAMGQGRGAAAVSSPQRVGTSSAPTSPNRNQPAGAIPSVSPSVSALAAVPTLAQEALLLTRMVEFLGRDTRLFPSVTFIEPLSQHMSFETFYRAVHPIFAVASDALGARTPQDVFADVAATWVIVHLAHIRMQHAFSRTLLVCTPGAGSGASTLINHLKFIRNDEELSAHSRERTGSLHDLQRIVVRRLAAETINDALGVTTLGGDVLILFTVEVADLRAAATQKWLREAVTRRSGRIVVVLTKLDEVLLHASRLGIALEITSPVANAARFVEEATKSVRAAVAADVQGLHVIPVALSPSKQTLDRIPALENVSASVRQNIALAFVEVATKALQELFQ